jgi:hypothetical protein
VRLSIGWRVRLERHRLDDGEREVKVEVGETVGKRRARLVTGCDAIGKVHPLATN